MVVWGSDVVGGVMDYHGGPLDRHLGLALVPRIDNEGNYLPHPPLSAKIAGESSRASARTVYNSENHAARRPKTV